MSRLLLSALVGACVAACGGGTGGPVDSGTPPPKCDFTTCLGCCFNGACQPGTTLQACGKQGEACRTCPTNTVCLPTQSCAVDPEGTWRVQPVSAQVAEKSGATGMSWDVAGGAPDVYIELWCPADAASSTKTPAVADSIAPTWSTGGCTAKAGEIIAKGVGVAAWDEDIATADSIANRGTVAFPEAALLDGGARIWTLGPDGGPGGNMPALRFSLTKQ